MDQTQQKRLAPCFPLMEETNELTMVTPFSLYFMCKISSYVYIVYQIRTDILILA